MKKVKFRIDDNGIVYDDIWFSDFDGDLFIPGCCHIYDDSNIKIEMLINIDENGNEVWEEIDNE